MTNAEHALHLLPRLSDCPPAVLAEVLRARAIAVDPDWAAVELATAMAAPDAIARHLEGLDRHTLDALGECREGSVGVVTKEALDTLLIHSSASGAALLPGVAEVWDEVEGKRLAAEATLASVTDNRPPDAASALVALAEFLEALESIVDVASVELTPSSNRAPATEWTKSPALARFPTRVLLTAAQCAQRIGFTRTRAGRMSAGPAGRSWRKGDLAHRWRVVLERWWALSPSWWTAGLSGLAEEKETTGAWRKILTQYPLVSPESLRRMIDEATMLGVLVGGHLSAVGAALTRGNRLTHAIEETLPPATGQLYPDGPDTVVAAGRLDPPLERTLRVAGRWHSGCLTPRFELSPHSVVASGTDGSAAVAQLHKALPEATASGLLHDIAQAIDRADSLRLRRGVGRVELASDHPEVLQVIAADYKLRPLGWKLEGSVLVTSAPAHLVHELLLAEGYWHRAELTSAGAAAPSESNHTIEDTPNPRWDEHSALALQRQMRGAASQELSCEAALALAIARKVSLDITVEVDGEPRVVSVAPSGLSNGRLRGLDPRAEVERTIPLAQIVSLTPSAP